MPVDRRHVEAVLQQYDAQGWHRTGTVVDEGSAQWLADEVRARGAEPLLEPWDVDRVDIFCAQLEAPGRPIEGLPLFDGTFSGPDGIEGTFGPAGSEAEIGFFVAEPHATAMQALRQYRRRGTHRALVLVTMGPSPGLAAFNATEFLEPYGPPVLQVASTEVDRLSPLAAAGARVRVVVHARRNPARALNVVAHVAGSTPGLPHLGVVTPRSGWWACASERGGGLACWLETLRAVQEARPARDVHFVSTSGHELDFIGFDAYLDRRPAEAAGAAFWLHLGANIGAAQPNQGVVHASEDGLLKAAVGALERNGAGPYAPGPEANTAAGEARNVARRGGRFISIVGGNAQFHLPTDRFPEAVKVESITCYAEACADLMVRASRAVESL